MSKDITKKQHYVWRRYLKSWIEDADGKEIWTGLLSSHNVKKIALMGVAQSRYFYKLEKLSEEELDFIILYNENLPREVSVISDKLVCLYKMYADIKREISKSDKPLSEKQEHELKKLELNCFEKIQSEIELMGDGLLKCNNVIELEKTVKENLIEVIFFLMVQYTRTASMKKRTVESMTDRKHVMETTDKTWPYINLSIAWQLTNSIIENNSFRFQLVRNESDIPFITGDQPVVNALGDISDENGYAKELELYYPLSPKLALEVVFTSGEKFEEKVADEEYVRHHNELIKSESSIHIFGNEEKVLRDILNR